MSFLKNRLFGIGSFHVTMKELITALLLSTIGFFYTTSYWVIFLNKLTPPTGYFLNLIMFYGFILLFSWLGLTFLGFKLDKWYNVFGLFFVTYAIMIITNLNSPYFNMIINNTVDNISNIYFQSADGAVWFFWDKIFDNIQILRFLTYVITPMILTLFGALLIKKEIKM